MYLILLYDKFIIYIFYYLLDDYFWVMPMFIIIIFWGTVFVLFFIVPYGILTMYEK